MGDYIDDGCELLVWAAAEIGTTIMAACIPILRVFFREVRERTHARSYASDGSRKNPGGSGGSGSHNSSGFRSHRAPGGSPAFSSGPFASQQPRGQKGGPPLSPRLDRSLGDGDSEKNILPIVHEETRSTVDSRSSSQNNGRIVRTQEYAIEYRDRGRGSSEAGYAHELTLIPPGYAR
jgi:hypothetical protein